MTSVIYKLFFLLLTIYEIKELDNKTGGVVVICFSVLVIIFANIMMWIR